MATQGFSTNTGIPSIPEINQSEYPEIYVDLLKIRNGIKVLQSVLDQYTGVIGEEEFYWDQQTNPANWHRAQNLTRTYAKASEDLTAGTIVNYFNVSGELQVRKANATTAGKPAHAWCTTTVASGSYGEFINEGTCFLIGGLTAGNTYYLSNTAGVLSSGSGTIRQPVGYALGANTLVFKPTLV